MYQSYDCHRPDKKIGAVFIFSLQIDKVFGILTLLWKREFI